MSSLSGVEQIPGIDLEELQRSIDWQSLVELPVEDPETSDEDAAEAQRWLDWQGHVELPVEGLEAQAAAEEAAQAPDEDAQEAQRWLDWLGHVELLIPGLNKVPVICQSDVVGDWEGWQGYVQQRLAYCYS